MQKLIILLAWPLLVHAQQDTQTLTGNNSLNQQGSFDQTLSPQHHKYVSVGQGKVYDVEIIVFAYRSPLPDANTYQDKNQVDKTQALILQSKPEDLSQVLQPTPQDLKDTDESSVTPSASGQYTVNIGQKSNQQKLLAWFKHTSEHLQLKAIWQRLEKNANIVPLIHKSWRQQQSAFDAPIYVNINDTNDQQTEDQVTYQDDFIEPSRLNDPLNNENYNNDNAYKQEPQILPDFHISGMVALSKGRFMHFGHQLKLYRQYYDDEGFTRNMSFTLSERRQIEPNELYYFDSPWFGSIVKVTEFTGKNDHE